MVPKSWKNKTVKTKHVFIGGKKQDHVTSLVVFVSRMLPFFFMEFAGYFFKNYSWIHHLSGGFFFVGSCVQRHPQMTNGTPTAPTALGQSTSQRVLE